MVSLDANIVIYLVEQNPLWAPKVEARIAAYRGVGEEIAVCDAARLECLVGPYQTGDAADLASYRAFFAGPSPMMLPVTIAIWERAARSEPSTISRPSMPCIWPLRSSMAARAFSTNDVLLKRFPDILVEILCVSPCPHREVIAAEIERMRPYTERMWDFRTWRLTWNRGRDADVWSGGAGGSRGAPKDLGQQLEDPVAKQGERKRLGAVAAKNRIVRAAVGFPGFDGRLEGAGVGVVDRACRPSCRPSRRRRRGRARSRALRTPSASTGTIPKSSSPGNSSARQRR